MYEYMDNGMCIVFVKSILSQIFIVLSVNMFYRNFKHKLNTFTILTQKGVFNVTILGPINVIC